MAVTREQKRQQLQALEETFKGVSCAILVDYKGLNVPQVTELRRQIRAVRARYRVVKNTLAKRALEQTPFEPLTPFLVGTTAVAYTGEDPVALAKALTAYAKSGKNLTIRAAVLDGLPLQPAEVSDLAALPGRPELYAKLLGVLQAPAVTLVRTLNAAPAALMNILGQLERQKGGA
jgi:large subunit ribosomal protein L10